MAETAYLGDYNFILNYKDKGEMFIMNNKKKLIQKYQQTLAGTKEEIFPLLCPVREKEWLQDWDYNMIYSESGYAEKGCMFETNNNYGSYRWIMTKHDSDNFGIQFVKTTKENIVVIIDIDLKEKNERLTYCKIQYTFIAIGEEASEHMYKENTEEHFNEHMKKWEDSLNYYLKHGEMLID
ncbi:MAG: hypothetical protein APF76_00880 [Desulfitibacter sp. BRH_c19]|nr:MAG: hypothetical protein APF76_00880 [Desulfitibacter sp. BRH_c19]